MPSRIYVSVFFALIANTIDETPCAKLTLIEF
jgi:hypothetical protein